MFSLIIAAVQSILQVMAIVFFGFCLTKAGYFTTEKQKWLSKLNLVFFTPCLLFSNISSIISAEKLLEFWPIPLFFIAFATLNFLGSRLVAWAFRLNDAYTRFVLACVMFSNANSLPVAVISSLIVSEAGKVLMWNADDTQSAAAARGISYAMFFAIFGNLLRWSYGYNLLQKDTSKEAIADAKYKSGYGALAADPELGQHYGTISRNDSSVTLAQDILTISKGDESKAHHHVNEATQLLPLTTLSKHEQKLMHSWHTTCTTWLYKIHGYMSPPLYASLLALLVGFFPPLKQLLYAKDGFLYPTLTSAIMSCGKAAVPIILVTLGSQLTAIASSSEDIKPAGRTPVTIAIVLRMGLAPLMVMPLTALFVLYGRQWSTLASDPVFVIMMIILGCTPTAINLVQISQVTGVFEDEMLRVLFWSYGVVCVPVFTLVVFAALAIVDKLV